MSVAPLPHLDTMATAWWSWALPLASQVAVVAAFAACVDLACGRRPRPRMQALVWIAVLAKVLVPPTLASPVSVVRLVATQPLVGAAADATVSIELVRIAVVAWFAGAVGLCAWAAVRHRIDAARVLRTTRPARARARRELARAAGAVGLRRVPEARLVPSAAGAAVVGLLRPTVLIPADLLRARDERLHHVLLHECAHIRRRDAWRSLGTFLVCAIAWPHPLVWLARRRLAALREIQCDDAAARSVGDGGLAYRRTLAGVARGMLEAAAAAPRGQLAFAMPSWAPPWMPGWPGSSLLIARLRHLRDGVQPRHGRDTWALAGLACVVALAFIPLANPPTPLTDLWAQSQGCMQKRLLYLRWRAESAPRPMSRVSDTRSPSGEE